MWLFNRRELHRCDAGFSGRSRLASGTGRPYGGGWEQAAPGLLASGVPAGSADFHPIYCGLR
jgi:hypothetical protein